MQGSRIIFYTYLSMSLTVLQWTISLFQAVVGYSYSLDRHD